MRRRLVGFVFAIAAAQAVQMSVAPRWTAIVWCVAGVALFFLALTEPRIAENLGAFGRRRPVLSTVVASLVGAAVFGGAWQAWLRSRNSAEAVAQSVPEPEPYSVAVRSALIHDSPEPLSLFMVGYRSTFGDTVSPAIYLANINVVNLRATPKTIEGYSVAVSDSPDGPWEPLKPISLLSGKLFSLGFNGGDSGGGSVLIPRGAYRLGTAMKREDLARVALVDPVPKLEAELSRPLQPHETVGGWAAFDLPKRSAPRIRNYFRVTLRDSTNVSFVGVAALPRAKPEDVENDTQAGRIQVVGPADISAFHVRFYSEPMPPPPASP